MQRRIRRQISLEIETTLGPNFQLPHVTIAALFITFFFGDQQYDKRLSYCGMAVCVPLFGMAVCVPLFSCLERVGRADCSARRTTVLTLPFAPSLRRTFSPANIVPQVPTTEVSSSSSVSAASAAPHAPLFERRTPPLIDQFHNVPHKFSVRSRSTLHTRTVAMAAARDRCGPEIIMAATLTPMMMTFPT